MSWTTNSGKGVPSPARRRRIDTTQFNDIQIRDLVLYVASLSRNPKFTQAQLARLAGCSERNIRMRFRDVKRYLKAELFDEVDMEIDDS